MINLEGMLITQVKLLVIVHIWYLMFGWISRWVIEKVCGVYFRCIYILNKVAIFLIFSHACARYNVSYEIHRMLRVFFISFLFYLLLISVPIYGRYILYLFFNNSFCTEKAYTFCLFRLVCSIRLVNLVFLFDPSTAHGNSFWVLV